MERTVFIDFDGTICFDRFWSLLPTTQYQQIQQNWFPQHSSLIGDWMRGVYSSEEVNELVASFLDVPYETLWSQFVAGCKQFHVEPVLLEQIQRLRKPFHVTLITGNMDCFSRFTSPALDLQQYFDSIVNSSEEGLLKTDNNGEIFKRHIKGSFRDAYLIEDSASSCDAFSNLGATALQVTRETPTIHHIATILSTMD